MPMDKLAARRQREAETEEAERRRKEAAAAKLRALEERIAARAAEWCALLCHSDTMWGSGLAGLATLRAPKERIAAHAAERRPVAVGARGAEVLEGVGWGSRPAIGGRRRADAMHERGIRITHHVAVDFVAPHWQQKAAL